MGRGRDRTAVARARPAEDVPRRLKGFEGVPEASDAPFTQIAQRLVDLRLVGYAFEVYEGEGACDPYDADGKVAYDAKPVCRASRWSFAAVAWLLALGGSVNALAGFWANRELLLELWRTSGRRRRLLRRAGRARPLQDRPAAEP